MSSPQKNAIGYFKTRTSASRLSPVGAVSPCSQRLTVCGFIPIFCASFFLVSIRRFLTILRRDGLNVILPVFVLLEHQNLNRPHLALVSQLSRHGHRHLRRSK